ncbi:carboxypeptidase-like regulatory domain-containing protein [Niabella ginsengisoli]|uniref:Carboxypeptidase-like regulatory domain-containing protein n=1 Tax=Niabella ginsengisoli TaxID=522298 RepID=A0ABS9SDJ0_9BACT|nr:carboxypeptidase-like regulatory domain-containing protein [Niabella ginsengisoli]MCH5596422.1 carboxypeptidase-like regulatory domain-containing protein [Niabella ginsengisoli]MCH5599491.1 carboxypeptidase-like regulatory domain-containing protein [Niabella ginsengisoli]
MAGCSIIYALLTYLFSFCANAQEKNINGKVVDSIGTEVEGVTINIKGTNRSVNTDAQGAFAISAVKGDMLEVTHVGYITKEVLIDEETSLVITIQQVTSDLEDVVVIGYGTSRKKISQVLLLSLSLIKLLMKIPERFRIF